MAVADIKRARERATKAVTARPSVGQATAVTRARITDGFTCEVTEGSWTFVADMPKREGGDEQGPTPGVFGRGALASCLAMGIVAWAAQTDVPLDGVSVEVQADMDFRGDLAVDDEVVPGYSQLRVVISVESPAPEAEVRALLQKAERYSPYIDVFRRANEVVVEQRISQRAAA